MPSDPDPIAAKPAHAAHWTALFVFLSLVAFSWIQNPIPGVNEPHYLCKARHFWDPSYCPGDFFLDSSDTHYVFYVVFGLLTQFLTLAQTAFVGRLVALALVAFGWTRLVQVLLGRSVLAIPAAMLFLGITSIHNFSGEWVIGGIESKVPAYGLVLLGWSCLLEGRGKGAGVCAGLAVSFHPLVGGWSVIASVLGLLWYRLTNRHDRELPRRSSVLASFLLLGLLSLPGLIPALATILQPTEHAELADRTQVFHRLGHHLNPSLFPQRAWVMYGVMLAVWLFAVWRRRHTADARTRVWNGTVLGAIVIAVAGVVVWQMQEQVTHPAIQTLSIKLMKFYPFRLFDVLLPLAVCVELCRWGDESRLCRAALLVASVGLFAVSLSLDLPSRNPQRYAPAKLAAWIEMCHWIDANLPPDAEIITPSSGQTFKWYASRAQYVCFKDCPQDPEGLLEWRERRRIYGSWASDNYGDKIYSAEETAALREQTGCRYLLTSGMGPFEIEPFRTNSHYRLYRLPD